MSTPQMHPANNAQSIHQLDVLIQAKLDRKLTKLGCTTIQGDVVALNGVNHAQIANAVTEAAHEAAKELGYA
ncbi:MAG: hypothetical protein HRU18_02785 [Pseudoalteromonas sp.]|uniref:hypothetical protein n=1 Tax=Pseudoalteromonas sp. TaxID=53249 RepID=UPI001D48FE16|nr:hypothetical protein [Pseudoalteromonas sp.]NRA77110.1 hypothetical protein [Pseudoalteromonas sp.]